MDRLDSKLEKETSILGLLDSIKHLLSPTESRSFMGANRQSIDVSFSKLSNSVKYAVVFKFINDMFFDPLQRGIIKLSSCLKIRKC